MGNEYENLKKQRYLQFVQQCARSGKSKREWCRENGVKYSTFMRWQRQVSASRNSVLVNPGLQVRE